MMKLVGPKIPHQAMHRSGLPVRCFDFFGSMTVFDGSKLIGAGLPGDLGRYAAEGKVTMSENEPNGGSTAENEALRQIAAELKRLNDCFEPVPCTRSKRAGR